MYVGIHSPHLVAPTNIHGGTAGGLQIRDVIGREQQQR